MWMNQSEVETAARQCAGHPVLGPATQFLKLLMESVNDQSDGWHSWPAPGKSAARLTEFIKKHTGGFYNLNSQSDAATSQEFLKTISPIRRMVTFQSKRQAQFGNTFVFDVDAALRTAEQFGGMPKPQTTNAPSLWDNDELQFTRLLTEIKAVGLTPEQMADLSRSMSLDRSRICELLDRAEERFEALKAGE